MGEAGSTVMARTAKPSSLFAPLELDCFAKLALTIGRVHA
jgi:hypothetical protein